MTDYQITVIKQMLHRMLDQAEANEKCAKNWERTYREKDEETLAAAYSSQAYAHNKHVEDLQKISDYVNSVTKKQIIINY